MVTVRVAGAKQRFGPAEIERLGRAAQRVFGERPEVVAAYLYGSAARGEPAADIDIAVLFRDGSPNARELERLAAQLQADGAPRGPEIDLRPVAGTSPRFRANVLRDARLLYEGDGESNRRLTFEARALGEWLDFKPTWVRMRDKMFARWTHG